MNIRLVGAIAAVVSLAHVADAGIVVTTNQDLWTANVATFGSVEVEDFNGIADDFYTSPFGGVAGSVTWSASAAGGLYVQDGLFSTNNPEPLTISFGPGVRAVAGNFFGTDINFNTLTVIFQVALVDGPTYEGFAVGASTFTGFRGTNGELISSLTLTVVNPQGSPAVYPTVDNLFFGVVPAPGAAALLGAAGLVGVTLRRR